jgi:hypothetical protein
VSSKNLLRFGTWFSSAFLAAVAAGVAAIAPALAAQPKTVKLDASIVTRESDAFKSEKDPGRCLLVAFAMFPDVKGATSYSVHVDGLLGSGDVSGGGPPFPYDRYSITSGPKTVWFVAPAGQHWFPLASGSSGRGCAEGKANVETHFKITSATATIDPDSVGPPKPSAPKELRPHKLATPLLGPVMPKSPGGRVLITRVGLGSVRVYSADSSDTGFRVQKSLYQRGEMIIKTDSKTGAKVSSMSGETIVIGPGMTVKVEAGKPVQTLEWTPGAVVPEALKGTFNRDSVGSPALGVSAARG